MIELYKKEQECCGCGACAAICPTNDIAMQGNDEGFLYPKILKQENCLNCGLCLSVCPVKHIQKGTMSLQGKEFYAGVINDDQVWERSASGGAFAAICQVYRSKNPIVFGARWEKLNVVMDFCEGSDNITPFQKSKYVAADTDSAFQKAKRFLQDGRTVIFSGTPCQINGLLHFLGMPYEKLLLIDFACHGQGSPMVFRRWMEYLSRKNHSSITSFQFREKKVLKDHVYSFCSSYTLKNRHKVIETRDLYLHSYVNGLCIRKSCQNCQFASNRLSDITLADFKNLREGLPNFHEMKNVSTIIANTAKGYEVCEQLSISFMRLYKPDSDFVLKHNPKLYKNLPGNNDRDHFMEEIKRNAKPIRRLIKIYAPIYPSQFVEYHCSTKMFNRLSTLINLLDKMCFYLFHIPRYLIQRIRP